MGKKLGGANPAAVAAVVVVTRRGRAGARRGKPARKRATVAAPAAAPAPAPKRVTVSGKGRPRALPASTVGRCSVVALPGIHDGRAAREAAAAPRVHEVPSPLTGEALHVVGGVACIVDRATGEIVESDVVFAGPVYRPRRR